MNNVINGVQGARCIQCNSLVLSSSVRGMSAGMTPNMMQAQVAAAQQQMTAMYQVSSYLVFAYTVALPLV